MGVVVAYEGFRLTAGEPRTLLRTAESGRVTNRWVCPECGSWITSAPRPGAAYRVVRGGTLDNTSWLQPMVHLWTRSKQPWIALPEGSESFESQPSDLVGFFSSTVLHE